MLDIKFIRENPDLVKENIKKKFQEKKIKLVDDIIKKDEEYRKKLYEMEQLNAERNKVSAEISKAKKENKDTSALMQKAKEIPQKIAGLESDVKKLREDIASIQMRIPNIIHKSVPIGKNDKENVEIEKIGKPRKFDFEVKNHAELAEALGVADFDSSARVSGNGFFYLIGDLALLNQALIRFGINFMVSRGYSFVEPPLMIRGRVLNGVYSHEEIEAMSYKIDDEDLYLIATSEHPLIGMFIDQTIDPKNLPIKLSGYSQCFRKEVGAHGLDEKGLFRTHQFNKVEMVVICKPEESYKYYDEMLNNCKDIFKELGLPTRVLEICSGDLADLKAKSADLEAWSPRRNDYFEICSVSNLTDAQSRRLNMKVGRGKDSFFPHTLNNTAIATSRAMVAILENFQNADGSVTIPDALLPYMNGITKIKAKKK